MTRFFLAVLISLNTTPVAAGEREDSPDVTVELIETNSKSTKLNSENRQKVDLLTAYLKDVSSEYEHIEIITTSKSLTLDQCKDISRSIMVSMIIGGLDKDDIETYSKLTNKPTKTTIKIFDVKNKKEMKAVIKNLFKKEKKKKS